MHSRLNTTQLAIVLAGAVVLIVFAFVLVAHHHDVPERVRAVETASGAG